MNIKFLHAGQSSILVELENLNNAISLLQELIKNPINGIQELIPAARTILIKLNGLESIDKVCGQILKLSPKSINQKQGDLIEIEVQYQGDDLAEVAQYLNISEKEVIKRHTENQYVVAFCGFAAGFAYMVIVDENKSEILNVPRKLVPRTKILSGSVGLAGIFSGIYPKESPAGWQIIGISNAPLWDINKNPAALLQPASLVRFKNVDKLKSSSIKSAENLEKVKTEKPAIKIIKSGLQSIFQDLGRQGQASQGLSDSGAMDKSSLKLANYIVGNPIDFPSLEIAYGGFCFESIGDNVVSITGAIGKIGESIILTKEDGQKISMPLNSPISMQDGETLQINKPTKGVYNYLAIRGGFNIKPVLNSFSTDTLAKIGLAFIKSGDEISINKIEKGGIVCKSDIPAFKMPSVDDVTILDVILGPRDNWFTKKAIETLSLSTWIITKESNRIGLRLNLFDDSNNVLERDIKSELPSEGVIRGAIQVPASGLPVLFLADHPLTGGYPVIACLADYHLDLAGQLPIGAKIKFNIIK